MQQTYNLACVPPTSVSACGGCPCSHTARISRIASTRFRRNVSVEVSGHETLDSIPNLITLSPARSARDRSQFRRVPSENESEQLTVDSVSVRVHGAEASTVETVPGAEAARREDPFLTLGKERVVEQRVRFALAEQQAQAEEVAVDTSSRRGFLRVRVVRFGRLAEQTVAGCGL